MPRAAPIGEPCGKCTFSVIVSQHVLKNLGETSRILKRVTDDEIALGDGKKLIGGAESDCKRNERIDDCPHAHTLGLPGLDYRAGRLHSYVFPHLHSHLPKEV